MSNAINKVYVINKNADGTPPEIKGEPIIDISDTTAIATDVRQGKKFYLRDGSPAIGDDSNPSNISELTVTEFKNYTADSGTAWSQVFVDIPLENKTGIVPNKEAQTITPSENYEAIRSVKIEKIPDEYIIPSGTKQITGNGTGIDVAQYATIDVSVVGEVIPEWDGTLSYLNS